MGPLYPAVRSGVRWGYPPWRPIWRRKLRTVPKCQHHSTRRRKSLPLPGWGHVVVPHPHPQAMDSRDLPVGVLVLVPLRRVWWSPWRQQDLRRSLETPLIFQTVSMDFVGPRRYSGVDYHYAVLLDHGSRFAVTAAIAAPPNSSNACRIRGAYFDIRFRNFVEKELGIRWTRTSFWKLLGEATFAYNTAPHIAIGTSPFQKVFGIEACLPGAQAFHGRQGEESRQQSQYYFLQQESRWEIQSSTT
eukprot:GHVS01061256.1.p1 GENE.GHVS01061256.1~~GHVS01061256.1.p1  ORF type:complete len:245 (-),score=6.79 GHVS01061256.1:219-953(-)